MDAAGDFAPTRSMQAIVSIALLLLLTCAFPSDAAAQGAPAEIGYSLATKPAADDNPAGTSESDTGRLITPARNERASSSPARRVTGSSVSFWTTLVSLALVLAAILVTAKVLRKHVPGARRPLPSEALELLGQRTIEPRVAIHLVRLGRRILVLGASADGLRTLSEISDPVEVDLLAAQCRRPSDPDLVSNAFRSLLRKQISDAPVASVEGANEAADSERFRRPHVSRKEFHVA